MNIEKYLDAYYDKFGEFFPIFLFDSDKDMLETIKESIEKGVPFDEEEMIEDVPQKVII